jgi:hypothetical protein
MIVSDNRSYEINPNGFLQSTGIRHGGFIARDISFTAVNFVNIVILPLTNRHAQQLWISAVANCIYISTIPSATLFVIRYVEEQTASHRYVHGAHPVFTRRGHRRLLPVWPVKAALSGRIFDSEENRLETIIEILSGQPKNETKNAFVHWRETYQ